MKLAVARSRERKARFLQAYRRYGIVTLAAHRVGLGRQRIYKWCAEDENFKEQFVNAQEEILDMLELQLHKLATGQYSRAVTSGGKVVAYEEIRSETAILALLKANRAKFRERQNLSITGGDGGPVVVIKKEITATLIADVTRLLGEAGVGIPDSERPALNAASEEQPAASAMLDLRSRREP